MYYQSCAFGYIGVPPNTRLHPTRSAGAPRAGEPPRSAAIEAIRHGFENMWYPRKHFLEGNDKCAG